MRRLGLDLVSDNSMSLFVVFVVVLDWAMGRRRCSVGQVIAVLCAVAG